MVGGPKRRQRRSRRRHAGADVGGLSSWSLHSGHPVAAPPCFGATPQVACAPPARYRGWSAAVWLRVCDSSLAALSPPRPRQ